MDRSEGAVSGLRRLCVRKGSHQEGHTSESFAHANDIVLTPQEAQAMEAALARCMNEVDQYPDPFNTPVNINSCGGVMDSVLAPFTQELVA